MQTEKAEKQKDSKAYNVPMATSSHDDVEHGISDEIQQASYLDDASSEI